MRNNRKTILIILIITLFAAIGGNVFGQVKFIEPVNPKVMARGNTGVAWPSPYQSFFLNPAGYALGNHFTIVSANPWVFTSMEMIELLQNPEAAFSSVGTTLQDSDKQDAIATWLQEQESDDLAALLFDAGYTEQDIIEAGGPEDFFNNLTEEEIMGIMGHLIDTAEESGFPITQNDLNLPSGTTRVGASAGIAGTISGIGIGVFGLVDASLEGGNLLTTQGQINGQLSFHGGYAYQLDLDILKLAIGAQIRPALYLSTEVNASTIMGLMQGGDPMVALANMNAFQGFGVSLDLGAILEVWWFKFGLSAMDIVNSGLLYNQITVGDIMDDPAGTIFNLDTTEQLVMPMQLNFWVAFHPSIPGLDNIITFSAFADFRDINGIIEAAAAEDPNELLRLIKVGAEAKLLGFLSAGVGYDRGYFTGGVGLDLFILEINAAAMVGTLEIEEVTDFGVALEVAIRL